MARRKGSLKLGSNIEPQADAPLDARALVPTAADLTDAETFDYCYVGMIVAVEDTGRVYVLIGDPDEPDPTDAANWRELGSGGGASVKIKAGPGIKVESALNALGETEYTISLDLKLESVSEQLTIKEIES